VAQPGNLGYKAEPGPNQTRQAMPTGRIRNQEFSRLFLGGNLFAGYSHSRELTYVSTRMMCRLKPLALGYGSMLQPSRIAG